MSLVPTDELPPVNGTDYPTVIIDRPVDARQEVIDTWSQYRGFWRGVVIRNYDSQTVLWYKTTPSGYWSRIPPSAERSLTGWGSYLVLRSGDQSRNTIAEVELEVYKYG